MEKSIRTTKQKTLDIVLTAMFSAIIAVCAWIAVPMTVPFTLQTFGVFFACGLLGGKRGSISVLVYLALGAIGVPVFASFRGGFSVLAGPTGGYIVGFLASALVYWLITSLIGEKLWQTALAMVVGLAVCYTFGTVWFIAVYASTSGAIGFGAALAKCVLPFIIPDLAKIALAVFLSAILRKRVPR